VQQSSKTNQIALFVINQSEEALSPEIVERLSRRGVSYKKSFTNIKQLAPLMMQNPKSILAIVAPNITQLASELTYLKDQPLLLTTPVVFATVNSDSRDVHQLSKLPTIFLTPFPLTPAQFINKIEFCISWYNDSTNASLIKSKAYLMEGKIRDSLAVIAPKLKSPDIGSIASCLFYQNIRNSSDKATLENILLTAIQTNPTDLFVLLTILDFYLNAGMPETVLKLIQANMNKKPGNIFTLPYEFQANLMLNRINSCIDLLLQKKSFFEHDDSYKKVLIKCLYSAGKNMDSLSSDPLTPKEIEQLQELWQAQPKTQDKPA
jgi:hypothetical protein